MGVDYHEVFSPTFKPATLRVILALAATHDLHLRSIDFSSAYLNGDLEEEVYMTQPEGFPQGSPTQVLRLKKSLYGLKQAGRQWNKKLFSQLESMGFKACESDKSCYIYIRGSVKIILPIYVDDATLVSDSEAEIDKVILELQKVFKLRDLGVSEWLLKLKIERNWALHQISISQAQYAKDMLASFGMDDCKPVTTPMVPGLTLTKDMCPPPNAPEDREFKSRYLSAVGSLLYLSTMTRPDISYTVGVLARFSSNPGKQHMDAVKHLFRYIKGTLDYKLTFGPISSSGPLFTTYSDADYGGCKDSGKSTGGYVVMMGGAAVSWRSKIQPTVSQSTTEAEFVAASEAGKELKWMRNLLKELGFGVTGSSTLHLDNQSAIQVCKNPEHHGRMKHLDMKYFWIRDEVVRKVIEVVYVPTGDQLADILTKPLGRVLVQKFVGLLGLRV